MTAMEFLDRRGLDVELSARMGVLGLERDGGEVLGIEFRRQGAVVRRKYRRLTPGPEGSPKWWQDKGGVRCAFNEDALRDDSLNGQPVIITEGELDTVAAVQAGFHRTVSVPDGAPPPGERSAEDLGEGSKYDWLNGIRDLIGKDRAPEIIIASDGDENGAALLQDLSVLLGRFRCKFLVYPKARDPEARGRPRLKDLNEVLEDYGVKGVRETIERAQWLKIDGVHRMSELPPLPAQVLYEPRKGQFDLFAQNFKCRLGDFSVITGTPGFGKTSFAHDLFCGIASDNGLTIAWASFEQEPQRDHRRNLRTWFSGRAAHLLSAEERAAADAWIDQRHVFLVPNEDADADLEWLLDRMEAAVSRFAASIIVIDPWNELEHSRKHGETETEYTGRAIRALKRFAKAFRVHVCVIAHPTKSVKDADGKYKMPTLYDIAGSANWYNKADLGVIVHRETADDTLIKVQKSRYHEIIGKPGEVMMQFCADDRRFRETERVG
jgi:twinkle protein